MNRLPMKIALVTDGGLVPRGNPDRIESRNATRYGRYNIAGVRALTAEDFEIANEGYNVAAASRDPNRLMPLDVMRELEEEGLIGGLCQSFYSTTGFETTPENSAKMGQGIARELKAEGAGAAIFLSPI